MRTRIGRLEALVPKPAPSRPRTTLGEIRDLERHIAELDAEILAAGGTMEPEPDEVLPADLEAIEREIRALELAGPDRG